MLVPVIVEDGFLPRLRYKEVESLNKFGGADCEHQQVLESNAGFYIGTLSIEEEFNMWQPESRDSYGYWLTRKEAEEALQNECYPRNL